MELSHASFLLLHVNSIELTPDGLTYTYRQLTVFTAPGVTVHGTTRRRVIPARVLGHWQSEPTAPACQCHPERTSFSDHVELDIADAGDDIELAAEPDHTGSKRLQADGVAVLDLADARLRQPGRFSELGLRHPELFTDLSQLSTADRGQHLLSHLLAASNPLGAVPSRVCGARLGLDVPPVRSLGHN
ncbi:hypothetical protein [Dactylosporangium sp. NPDC005555]|uniref:hypothetical protein n=1 Tax=Dactylosporangium sp. NPDC005555 TaxID=3154889 RepID=UPI0033A04784